MKLSPTCCLYKKLLYVLCKFARILAELKQEAMEETINNVTTACWHRLEELSGRWQGLSHKTNANEDIIVDSKT